FFLIRFVPTSYITTFENDSIKFSISDKGTLGFYRNNSNQFGYGVGSKKLGNQIYKAGLMLSEDSSKIVTALFGLAADGSDFRVLKPFAGKDKNISIIDDSLSQQIERIGVQIQQFVYVPPDGENYFKIFFTLRNTSGKVLKNLSLGYYQDWDVGTSAKENFSYLEPDAIPKSILPISAAVQFIQSLDSSVFVGVGVISDNSTYIPQSAVLSSDFTSAFSRDKQILSLNSGTRIQFSGVDDISIVSGMKFPGEIYPDETRTFTMMISITDSRENLKQIFLKYLLENPSNYSDGIENMINLYPNPTSEFVYIQPYHSSINSSKYQIINHFGNVVDEGLLNSNVLNVSQLSSGVYYLKIYSMPKVFFQKFVLIR
ncbi:MAG: T9SS type A sorting domain-containing protein, partial [Candidatus Kapaibacteriota bacterium]